jgi:AraC-like DNA-binding protein
MKIGEACAKLTGSERPITHIAGAVGYNSLANFNRQF